VQAKQCTSVGLAVIEVTGMLVDAGHYRLINWAEKEVDPKSAQ
jgi:hypothetical protein